MLGRILLIWLFATSAAMAQSYPSPTYNTMTLTSKNGLIVGNGSSPISAIAPGTGVASALGNAVNGTSGFLTGASPDGVSTLLSGGSLSAVWTPPGTGGVQTPTFNIFKDILLPVDAYGADPTGANNSATAWQNAINQADFYALNGAGTVIVYGCGQYKLTSQLTVNTPGVKLQGCGGDSNHNVSFTPNGTRFIWAGSSGGTMVSFSFASGASAWNRSRGGVSQIKFDCNSLAAICLEVVNWYGGDFENLMAANPLTSGKAIRIATNAATGDAPGTQMNLFRNIAVRTIDVSASAAPALSLESDGTTFVGNVSFNTFENIDTLTANGHGIDCKFCDNNTFINVRNYTTGSGYGVVLRATSQTGYVYGGANANTFVHLSPGSNGVLSEGTGSGTYAAVQNQIIGYDVTNGTPLPTIGTGSTLFWATTNGQTIQNTPVSYTPTVTCGSGSGTFTTTNAGQYTVNYKTVNLDLQIPQTANSSCASYLSISLPIANNSNHYTAGSGVEIQGTGYALAIKAIQGSSTLTAQFYNGTFTGGAPYSYVIHITYQID